MAKARKAAADAKKGKSRTKVKTKYKAKTKRSSARKSRPKNVGTEDKISSAVRVVTGAIQETSEMRRKMGGRGGIDEG